MRIISGSVIEAKKSRRKVSRAAKWRQARRDNVMERLEDRTLFNYTFSFNPGTDTATAQGAGNSNSLVLEASGGQLLYSVNGSAFSANWGGNPVPLSSGLMVNINVVPGDGAKVDIGTPSGPISDMQGAQFNLASPPNTQDSVTLDDSGGTTLATGGDAYTVNTGPGTVSGPGFLFNETSSAPNEGGITLLGSSVDGNVYNVQSLETAEPFSVITGATGASVVNVGDASTFHLAAPVAITSSGGTITLNADSHLFNGNNIVTLDNLSGNATAPFEIAGLSAFPIEYGTGVTAVNLSGGTDGSDGDTFNINDTQLGTTTSITGAANPNFFDLSNSSESGGLDNLQGAVIVHGGSSGKDVVTLDDSSADFSDDYTITGTTVARSRFGGLTYDNTIGTLALNAENTLGIDGNNTIDINSTADGITTDVNSQGGLDTVDVNGTGTSGTLNVTTGSGGGDTVNVIADSTAVNVFLNNLNFGPLSDDIVNIGSTGTNGSMTGIQGPISILDDPSYYVLNFHDEIDHTGHTWTLNESDGSNTASVAVSGSATTSYRPGDVRDLNISGGFGGNTFIVNNTTSHGQTTINSGDGNDTVMVYSTSDNTLQINGDDGTDVVELGDEAGNVGMQALHGTINITNYYAYTSVTLNDSEDLLSRDGLITDNGSDETVTGISPATINMSDTDVSGITVDSGLGSDTFTVDALGENDFNAITNEINTGAVDDNVVNIDGTGNYSFIEVTGTGTDNVVNLDAQGTTPSITSGGVDEVDVGLPEDGEVSVVGYEFLNITDIAPVLIVPGSADSIFATEGEVTGPTAGSFTFTVPQIGQVAFGVAATDFTSTIDWGDPSPDLIAGSISQDDSNKSLYHVNGTHTYSTDGMYTVANSVDFIGATYSSTLSGVDVSVTVAPTGPTAGTDATETVTHASIPVTVSPVTGTEGQAIAAGAIATFIDEGGPHSGDYTAEIVITDEHDNTIIDVSASSIVEIGDSNEFTVNAPSFTIPEEGTYTVAVTVTDNSQPDVYTSSSTAAATITDAPLTDGSGGFIETYTGNTIGFSIAQFTDANPTATVGDFTGTIDWGDGTANTTATFTQPGGVGTVFDVAGTHAYAFPGTYNIQITVDDDGGSVIHITAGALITDHPVSGSVNDFEAIQNVNTGTIVLATFNDINPLATDANVTATLPAGGWGDGTPASPITLPIVYVGVEDNESVFEVTGSHTYASHGNFPVNITITTSGGAVTNLTTGNAFVPNPQELLKFASQPPTATAGQFIHPFSVDVQSLSHQTLKNNTDPITIAVASGPTHELLGTTTVDAVHGVATFVDLQLDVSGKYTFIVTDGGVTANSKSFTVNAGPVDFITIASPVNIVAGVNEPGIAFSLFDQDGNQTTGNQTVTVSIVDGPAGARIVGKTTFTAKNGAGTITGLSFPVAGNYILLVRAGSVTTTTDLFNVLPGVASAIKVLPIATPVTAGNPISSAITVQVTDKLGNLLTDTNSPVSLSLLKGPLGGVLSGATTVDLNGGQAVFNDLQISTPGTYVLLASFGGLSQQITLTILPGGI